MREHCPGRELSPTPSKGGSSHATWRLRICTSSGPFACADVMTAEPAAGQGTPRKPRTQKPTARRNDDGPAPHPVNVVGNGFTYSHGPGTCRECGGAAWPRGLYRDGPAGPLPFVHARVRVGYGRDAEVHFSLSRAEDSRHYLISPKDIETGKWADRLGMALSADRHIRDAAATAIRYHLAYDPGVPERDAAPRATDRTPTGHLPVPDADAMPDGYFDRPTGVSAAELRQAERIKVRIAAATPALALEYAASVAAPFAKAAGLTVSPLFDAYGRERQGKTTALTLGASVWGDPDKDYGLVMSFDNSRKGVGRFLGGLGIFPVFFDESGASDLSKDDRRQLALKMGARRVLSTMDGTASRSTAPWSSFWFVSGNGRFADGLVSGRFAGIVARVIDQEGPFTRSAADCDRLGRLCTRYYGWVGPEVLRAVTVADMAKHAAEARGKLGIAVGGARGTLADILALTVAAAVAVGFVTGTGPMLARAALKAARAWLGCRGTVPETDADRMLHAIAQDMAADRAAWKRKDQYEYDTRDHVRGVIEDGWVYVFARAWHELAEAAEVDESITLADLHKRAALHVPDRARQKGEWQSRAPRWAGQAAAYRVQLSAIQPDDDDDDGQGDDPGALPGPDSSGTGFGEDWPAGSYGAAASPPAGNRGRGRKPKAGPCWACGAVHATGGEGYRCPACIAADVTRKGQQAPAETETDAGTFIAEAVSRGHVTTEAQREALAARLAVLDDPGFAARIAAAEAAGDKAAREQACYELASRLRFLAALDDDGVRGWAGGPFAPGRKGLTIRFRPDLPAPAREGLVWAPSGWPLSRKPDGPVVVLDRNADHLSAAATVPVPHGELEHTGPAESFTGAPRPGFYLVTSYPWTEPGIPSPLAHHPPHDPACPDAAGHDDTLTCPACLGRNVWVPAPHMHLLADLARAGRWPDGGCLDSWTAEPVRLDGWAHFMGEARRYAITQYGKGSYQDGAVKEAFGMARGLMLGEMSGAAGSPEGRRRWKCKARRPDITWHIVDQAMVTGWRKLDQCRAALPAELAPFGLTGVDELHLPAAALPLLTEPGSGAGGRPAIVIDPTFLAFGTYKIKKDGETP